MNRRDLNQENERLIYLIYPRVCVCVRSREEAAQQALHRFHLRLLGRLSNMDSRISSAKDALDAANKKLDLWYAFLIFLITLKFYFEMHWRIWLCRCW